MTNEKKCNSLVEDIKRYRDHFIASKTLELEGTTDIDKISKVIRDYEMESKVDLSEIARLLGQLYAKTDINEVDYNIILNAVNDIRWQHMKNGKPNKPINQLEINGYTFYIQTIYDYLLSKRLLEPKLIIEKIS